MGKTEVKQEVKSENVKSEVKIEVKTELIDEPPEGGIDLTDAVTPVPHSASPHAPVATTSAMRHLPPPRLAADCSAGTALFSGLPAAASSEGPAAAPLSDLFSGLPPEDSVAGAAAAKQGLSQEEKELAEFAEGVTE